MSDRNEGAGAMDARDDVLPDDWMEAARSYHRPPETPRAEMWEALRGELDGARALSLDEARERRHRRSRTAARWLGPAAA
ncbi:MAG TPA: hypothetical protein VLL48_06805, partial [Longimicrobiales bacterium]|nr:hypothetical protein [Longimicrobiales bacterium]